MRREAKRTLYSLTEAYQREVEQTDYEVIVIDSSSTEPLDGDWVVSLQENFHYYAVNSTDPSPCRALNFGIERSQGECVACCIDGARILSPGVLSNMLRAHQLFDNAFVYTLGLHLGDELQNKAIEKGYSQEVEDRMLETVPWQADGYRLFDISCLAASSSKGYLGNIIESNCFSARKDQLSALGGFDERFKTPGGGLVNLDVFKQFQSAQDVQPVLILGEGTFHQFHGGVATNVPLKEHPWSTFSEEYESIRGERFAATQRRPFLLGMLPDNAARFLNVVE